MSLCRLVCVLGLLCAANGHTRTFGAYSYVVESPPTGMSVWTTAASHRINDVHELPTLSKKGFFMSAARNEFEPLQIILKADKAETWKYAAVIPGVQKITFHKATYRNNDLAYELVPQGGSTGAVSTVQGKHVVLWLTAFVAPGASSTGLQKGTFTLTSPNGQASVYDLDFYIYNFQVSGSLNYMIHFTVGFGSILPGGSSKPDEVKQFIYDHRITPKGGATWPSGFKYDITWESTSNPNKCSKFYDEPDEPDPYSIKFLSKKFLDGKGWNCLGFAWHMALQFIDNNTERPASFCGNSLGSDAKGTLAYNTAWAAYLTALRDYLTANGWQNKVFYYVQNEPQNEKDYEVAISICQLARSKAPGLKLCLSEEPKPEIAEQCAFDIWASALGEYNRTYAWLRGEQGLPDEQVWLYSLPQDKDPYPNPSNLDNQGIHTRIWGFVSWAERTRGYWYYNAGTWFSNGNPTVQLEMFREASEDYEYLWLANGKAHPKPCTMSPADLPAYSAASGLKSWSAEDDSLMDLRHQLGLYLEGSRATAPVMVPKPSPPPAPVYINFQDPAGEPTAAPLVIDGKTWIKMGWASYDTATGIGWKGGNAGKDILKSAYRDTGDKDSRWYSFLYDDYGKTMQFSYPVNPGQYDVTVAVGYPGKTYNDKYNVVVNGVACITNYHSKATGIAQINQTVTVDLSGGNLQMVVGGRDDSGKDAYTFLAWVSLEPSTAPPSKHPVQHTCDLLNIPVVDNRNKEPACRPCAVDETCDKPPSQDVFVPCGEWNSVVDAPFKLSYQLGYVKKDEAIQFQVTGWPNEYGAVGLRAKGDAGSAMKNMDVYSVYKTAMDKVVDAKASGPSAPAVDTTQDAVLVSNNGTTAIFYRLLATGDASDFVLTPGMELVWSYATGNIDAAGAWSGHVAKGSKAGTLATCQTTLVPETDAPPTDAPTDAPPTSVPVDTPAPAASTPTPADTPAPAGSTPAPGIPTTPAPAVPVPAGTCGIFNTRRADILRRHRLEQSSQSAFLPSAGNEKHTPYVTLTGTKAVVTVGKGTVSGQASDPVHPTVASRNPDTVHYIANIYVEDQDGAVIAMAELSATTDKPSLSFDVPTGTTSIRAFSFCNRHGLYAGTAAAVTATTSTLPLCDVTSCMEDTVGMSGAACAQFLVLEGEALRRQQVEQSRVTPFTPAATNEKHTPYVTISGTKAKVTVGKGTVTRVDSDPVHPTVGSDNPLTVHYIDTLYVKDQNGVVVAASSPSPRAGFPAFSFNVPAGTTSLTAFAFCNKHGLFQSATVDITAQSAVTLSDSCGVKECLGNDNDKVTAVDWAPVDWGGAAEEDDDDDGNTVWIIAIVATLVALLCCSIVGFFMWRGKQKTPLSLNELMMQEKLKDQTTEMKEQKVLEL